MRKKLLPLQANLSTPNRCKLLIKENIDKNTLKDRGIIMLSGTVRWYLNLSMKSKN